VLTQYPPADVELASIGDLVKYDLKRLVKQRT
jgi:hypothetical protein